MEAGRGCIGCVRVKGGEHVRKLPAHSEIKMSPRRSYLFYGFADASKCMHPRGLRIPYVNPYCARWRCICSKIVQHLLKTRGINGNYFRFDEDKRGRCMFCS